MISLDIEIHKNKKEIFNVIFVCVNGTILLCHKENWNLLLPPFHVESVEKFMTSDTGVPAAALCFNEDLFQKTG
jgi:hypothetical protein